MRMKETSQGCQIDLPKFFGHMTKHGDLELETAPKHRELSKLNMSKFNAVGEVVKQVLCNVDKPVPLKVVPVLFHKTQLYIALIFGPVSFPCWKMWKLNVQDHTL